MDYCGRQSLSLAFMGTEFYVLAYESAECSKIKTKRFKKNQMWKTWGRNFVLTKIMYILF